jgi:hypothetical protein
VDNHPLRWIGKAPAGDTIPDNSARFAAPWTDAGPPTHLSTPETPAHHPDPGARPQPTAVGERHPRARLNGAIPTVHGMMTVMTG